MPLLTSKDYLIQRQLLIEEWHDRDAIAFGDISFQGQHDLHDFYAPTESFSDAEALKHRAAMTKSFPSLLQKAGRALQALLLGRELHEQRVAARQAAGTTLRCTATNRNVRIASVARPKPDVRFLAKALIDLSISDTDGSLLRKLQGRQQRRRR